MKNRIIIIIIVFLFMLISFKLFNENAKIYIDKIDEINYKDNIKNNILKNYYESTFTTLIPKSNFESLFNELDQLDTDYEVYYSQIDVISQVESETTKINPNNILIYESYLSKYNFFEIVEGDMFDDIEYDISCDIPILASDNSGLIVGEEVKLRAVTKESYRENYLSDMYLKGKVVGLIKYYDESVSVIVPDLKNNLSQLGLDEFYTEYITSLCFDSTFSLNNSEKIIKLLDKYYFKTLKSAPIYSLYLNDPILIEQMPLDLYKLIVYLLSVSEVLICSSCLLIIIKETKKIYDSNKKIKKNI